MWNELGCGEADGWELADSRQMRNFWGVWVLGPEHFHEAHFATFPSEIPRRCILAGCPQGGLVLDCFNEAGTTGVAAVELGRRYRGIEINPEYVEMSNRRIQKAWESVDPHGGPLFRSAVSAT